MDFPLTYPNTLRPMVSGSVSGDHSIIPSSDIELPSVRPKELGKTLLHGLKDRSRCHSKAMKAWEGRAQYIIDTATNLDRFELLPSRALVGRLEYTSCSKKDLLEWVNTYWTPLVGMAPRVNILMNTWFLFIFPTMTIWMTFMIGFGYIWKALCS